MRRGKGRGGKEAAGKLISSALTIYCSSHLWAAGCRLGLAQEQNGEMCRSPCVHTGNPE